MNNGGSSQHSLGGKAGGAERKRQRSRLWSPCYRSTGLGWGPLKTNASTSSINS